MASKRKRENGLVHDQADAQAAVLPLAALPDTAAQALCALLDTASRRSLRLVCKTLKAAADRQLETVAIDCTGACGAGPADVASLLERHPLAARLSVLCSKPPTPQAAAAAAGAIGGVEAAAVQDMAAALQRLAQAGVTWPSVSEVTVGYMPQAPNSFVGCSVFH
jgi:hypothetical protein